MHALRSGASPTRRRAVAATTGLPSGAHRRRGMWKRVAITTVDVPAEDLWEVATDVRRWPEWDPAIEAVAQAGEVRAGAVFVVNARGGRQLRVVIEECSP